MTPKHKIHNALFDLADEDTWIVKNGTICAKAGIKPQDIANEALMLIEGMEEKEWEITERERILYDALKAAIKQMEEMQWSKDMHWITSYLCEASGALHEFDFELSKNKRITK